MIAEQYRNLLWDLAVVFGWLSPLALAMRYYAQIKFKALLKAPLTDEVEHLTHLWERRLARWTFLGFLLPCSSLLCFLGWFILARTTAAAA